MNPKAIDCSSHRNSMVTFRGDPQVKEDYLNRVLVHATRGEISKAIFAQHNRFTAVGCTVHSDDVLEYEKQLGISAVLAGIEEKLFFELPLAEAIELPFDFLLAIEPGKDLTSTWKNYIADILVDEKCGALRWATSRLTIDTINDTAALLRRMGDPDRDQAKIFLEVCVQTSNGVWALENADGEDKYAARRAYDAAYLALIAPQDPAYAAKLAGYIIGDLARSDADVYDTLKTKLLALLKAA